MIGSYTQTWNAHLCRLQVRCGGEGEEGRARTQQQGTGSYWPYGTWTCTALALDLSPGLSFLGLSDSLAQPLQALSLFGQPTTSLESLQTDAGGTYTGLPNT